MYVDSCVRGWGLPRDCQRFGAGSQDCVQEVGCMSHRGDYKIYSTAQLRAAKVSLC